MKVIVNAKVEYTYEVDVPPIATDFVSYCDTADPVYFNISKELSKSGLDFEGTIINIIDKDTYEVLYEY